MFVNFVATRFAPVNTTFVTVAESKFVFWKSSPVKFAPVRSLPDRSAYPNGW